MPSAPGSASGVVFASGPRGGAPRANGHWGADMLGCQEDFITGPQCPQITLAELGQGGPLPWSLVTTSRSERQISDNAVAEAAHKDPSSPPSQYQGRRVAVHRVKLCRELQKYAPSTHTAKLANTTKQDPDNQQRAMIARDTSSFREEGRKLEFQEPAVMRLA
ncbi:unnamed protein product [Rangifer tarandus platyrhynchus]|uniref:Uncharacterized protein n=2 Tax=Rangifer tarandus platyrhynchus TaxID=3082113 RepID=A0ABN8YKG4_RANTA|nr:unnamed protein product [Rangifer tarandus platyrhynchus]CAI9698802.1 unnamed protein product [Rangifer tarandus platyrhynchus]